MTESRLKARHPAFTRWADHRLTVPAVFAWGAAFVLVAQPGAAASALLVAVACLSASLALWRALASAEAGSRRGRVLRRVRGGLPTLAVCAGIGACIATAVLVLQPLREPPLLVDSAQQTLSAELEVLGTPSETAHSGFGGESVSGVRFEATLQRVQDSAGSSDLTSTRVLLFVDNLATVDAPVIGSTIRVDARFRPTDDGSQTAWLAFAEGRPQTIQPPGWQLAWAADLRARFADAARGLPGDGAELVPGLALGDDSLVDASLDEAMKDSGLSHLTAVSGANCAIVIAGAFLLAGFAGLRRGARLGAAGAVLVLFVILVTPQPSVIRAAAMAAIVLVSIGASRSARGMPVLCLAVVSLIVTDPWLSHSFGFALSSLATAGLLLFTRPLTSALSRWTPTWLAAVIAVPLAAQLACQPVLVLLTPTIAPYSIPANLLAAPAAPIATVVGLLACLMGALIPPLAVPTVWLCWLPAAWIGAVARFFAGAPGARLPWVPGLVGALLVLVLTALALWVVLASGTPRLRRITAVFLVAAVVGVYGGVLVGGTIALRLSVPQNWRIAACDVGQGDAVLVRSGDAIALIDTGPEPDALRACLDRMQIGRIDLLVLTHFDLDHIGGIGTALGRADAVLVGPTDGGADERVVRRLVESGATVRQAARGDRGELGALRWDVLWPVVDTTLRGNGASVTLRFSGDIDALFLGDLGESDQAQLMAEGRIGPVDVVKVAHHGSGDQSAELYNRIHAPAGIISVGADNDYGHPNDRILEILADASTRVFRTDQLGLIVVSIEGDDTVVWSERKAAAGAASAVSAPPSRLDKRTDRVRTRGYCTRRKTNGEGLDPATLVGAGSPCARCAGIGHGVVSRRAQHPAAP
ncbi:competence protein ComEC [Agreia bicolorata]|uniref:Competence protein ComEC n=1 Tax=Agreia bicolorata TaxID=110935 RepID=A0A1T4YJJ5_9MICO|nr:ComEC/Rec2 family competence protein [Agreia bicolorata]SKB01728.1 competence protein ComEC [Agreia bicolorata]